MRENGRQPNPARDARIEKLKDLIKKYWEENHGSPSIRDLADYMGLSTSMITIYIKELEEVGWLEKREHGTFKGHILTRTIIPSEIFANRPVFPGVMPDFGQAGLLNSKIIQETASAFGAHPSNFLDQKRIKS